MTDNPKTMTAEERAQLERLQMTPQQINEAVARKLGWTFHADLKPICWQVPPPGKVYLRDVPDFCHKIEAAWEVVDKLHSEQKNVEINRYPQMWMVKITGLYASSHAESDTASMAICLAFLKLPTK